MIAKHLRYLFKNSYYKVKHISLPAALANTYQLSVSKGLPFLAVSYK